VKRFAIRHSTGSHQDYAKLIDYVIETSGLEAAAAVDARLERSISTLTVLANRGRVVPELKRRGAPLYREILSGPYRIIYRVMEGEVLLVAILDGRRQLYELLLARARRFEGPGGEA
jgi:toxin ParE1/3/4